MVRGRNKILRRVPIIVLIIYTISLYFTLEGDTKLLGRDEIVYQKLLKYTKGVKNINIYLTNNGNYKELVEGEINFESCKERLYNSLTGEIEKSRNLPVGEFKPLLLLSPDQTLCTGLKKASNWIRVTNNNQFRYVFYRYHNRDLRNYDGNSVFSTHMWQYNNIVFTDLGNKLLIEITDISGVRYYLSLGNSDTTQLPL